MNFYLAGPINGCTDDEAVNWRERSKVLLGYVNCVDPMVRDYRGKEDSHYREIVLKDLEDIDGCDVVLANCWTPSVGTSMELWYAHSNGIPIVAIVPEDAPVSPWIRYVASSIVHNVDDGTRAVYEIWKQVEEDRERSLSALLEEPMEMEEVQ